jgi:hypothetical protein
MNVLCYNRKVLADHPDKGGSSAAFTKLDEARRLLLGEKDVTDVTFYSPGEYFPWYQQTYRFTAGDRRLVSEGQTWFGSLCIAAAMVTSFFIVLKYNRPLMAYFGLLPKKK